MPMINGYVVYEGPSNINGKGIVVIATGLKTASKNSKTGGLVQVYVLSVEDEPQALVTAGLDDTICGDCVHRGVPGARGRSCYVQIGQGPTSVFRAWKRGRYPKLTSFDVFRDLKIRFGTYGDPAAVPHSIWKQFAEVAKSFTGYTHQWKTCDVKYANYCMASADSEEDAVAAQAKGYRTFRVVLDGQEERFKNEAICPASKEAGHKLQCSECMMCNGIFTSRRGNIVIRVHGNTAHISNAKKLSLAIAA